MLSLLGGTSLAQEPTPSFTTPDPATISIAPTPRSGPAAERFLTTHGSDWILDWCAATGTPKAIFGPGLPLADWRENTLQEATRHAEALLREHQDLLGLGTSEFRPTIAARMGRCWTFTWQQYFRGLPVIGGRADLKIAMVGRCTFLGSHAFPVAEEFPITPRIDEANAERIAWQRLEVPAGATAERQSRQIRLVIWGDVHANALAPTFLAWEVPVAAIDQQGVGPIGRYYIDANTGAILHWQNDKHECGIVGCEVDHRTPHSPPPPPATYTVMARARDGGSGLTAPTNVPLAGVEIAIPGVGTVITNAAGQFTASLAAPTNVTVRLDGIHTALIGGTSPVNQTATLQPGVGSVIQLLGSSAGDAHLAHTTCYLWTHRTNEFVRSILGNTPELAVADSIRPTVNFAATCNAYYTGNTMVFYQAGNGCTNTASASVIAHEWGHGLDDRYGGISQVHGLSEAWGDIVSMYLLDDPVIAPGFFTDGRGIRNGNNSRTYPPPAPVHDAGEVFMGFAWRFRQNLRTTFGTAGAQRISNEVLLGSIVADATDQPGAVLQVFLADDDDGNLSNGTPHYAQLAAAALEKNLPYPTLQTGFLSHVPLGSTGRPLTPRLVRATASAPGGSITEVRVVWNDGAARSRRMIPTAIAGQYQALLPAQAAPATMRYHLEADRNNGPMLRLPTTGEFSYSVGGINPVTRLSLLPEQGPDSLPYTTTVATDGPQPFLLYLADNGGPTTVPGIGTFLVGGNVLTLAGVTDNQGRHVDVALPPMGIAVTGLTWYSQVLSLDRAGAFAFSNQFLNLFTRADGRDPPRVPSNLRAANVWANTIDVNWNDDSGNENGFETQISADGTNYAPAGTTAADAQSFRFANLQAVTTYWLRVRAFNAAGNSPWLGPIAVVTRQGVPAAPANVRAGNVWGRTIDINWDDLSNNETEFHAELSSDGVAFGARHIEPANDTGARFDGLQPVTTYWFRVRASNAAGDSAWVYSPPITTRAVPPDAPGNVRAGNVWGRTIDINWDDLSNNETEFHAELSSDGVAFGARHIEPANDTGARFDALQPVTTYWFRVRSSNAAGDSAWVYSPPITTRAVPPDAPGNVRAGNVWGRTIDINWDDLSNNETEFHAERSTDGTNFGYRETRGADSTGARFDGLQPVTTYWFRVRASNAVGDSAWVYSPPITTPDEVPTAPSNVRAANRWATQIDVAWNDNSHNETHFEIERSPDGVTFLDLRTTGANNPVVRYSNLRSGTRYWFRVRAVNGVGASAWVVGGPF